MTDPYVLLKRVKIPRKQAKLPMVLSVDPKTGKCVALRGIVRTNALKRAKK